MELWKIISIKQYIKKEINFKIAWHLESNKNKCAY